MRIKKRHKSDEYRQKRTKLILAIFICVLMVGSILVIWVESMNPPNTQDYNGYKVTQTNLGFKVKNSDGKEMLFDNFPNYVETVNSSFNKFYSAIIIFNPNENENLLPFFERAVVNMQLNFYKIQIPMGFAVSEAPIDNSTIFGTYPVIDCDYENATVINLVIGDETKISQFKNCIIVSGSSGPDLLLAKDALLFKYLKN